MCLISKIVTHHLVLGTNWLQLFLVSCPTQLLILAGNVSVAPFPFFGHSNILFIFSPQFKVKKADVGLNLAQVEKVGAECLTEEQLNQGVKNIKLTSSHTECCWPRSFCLICIYCQMHLAMLTTFYFLFLYGERCVILYRVRSKRVLSSIGIIWHRCCHTPYSQMVYRVFLAAMIWVEINTLLGWLYSYSRQIILDHGTIFMNHISHVTWTFAAHCLKMCIHPNPGLCY